MSYKIREILRLICILAAIALLGYSLTGCALSSSQLRHSNSFYSALEDIDNQILTLNKAVATVEFERKKLNPAGYTNDSTMINELVDSYQKYHRQIYSSDTLFQAAGTFGSYIGGFQNCLPKPRQSQGSDKKVLKAVEDFSSYLPFGIGLTVFNTVYDIFHYIVSAVKVPVYRKRVRSYITKGENLVPEKSEILLKYSNQAISILDEEMVKLKNDYASFLSSQRENKTSFDYYSLYNPVFLKQYQLAYSAKELSLTLSVLLPQVSDNYKYLFSETRERKRLRGGIPGFVKMNYNIQKTQQQSAAVNEAMK